MHANKATVPFMRRLRRVLGGEGVEGEEARKQWLHQFLTEQVPFPSFSSFSSFPHPPRATCTCSPCGRVRCVRCVSG